MEILDEDAPPASSVHRYGGEHSQLLFPHLSLTYVLLVLIVAFILN